MKVGDLVMDYSDGEIGTVVAPGPGLCIAESKDYPDGFVPSWKVSWPSLKGLYDFGEDDLLCGDYKIISKA